MKKAIDVKINIRPVYSNLVHTDIWEGPCRVGPAELLDPAYEKRAGLEQFSMLKERLEANLDLRFCHIMDPVYIEWDESFVVRDEQLDQLNKDIADVDVFLINYRVPGIEKFGKTISMIDISPTSLDLVAFYRTIGVDAFFGSDYEEYNYGIFLRYVRKAVANTKWLILSSGEQLTESVNCCIRDLYSLTQKYGIRNNRLPMGTVFDLMEQMEMTDAMRQEAEMLLESASAPNKMGPDRVSCDIKFREAVWELMERYDCNGFTINCKALCASQRPWKHKITPCLCHSMNKDMGIPSACEEDTNALLTMTMFTYMSQKAIYMANPQIVKGGTRTYEYLHIPCDPEDKQKLYPDTLLELHHAVPSRKMAGYDKPDLPYFLSPFTEEGFGTRFQIDVTQDAPEEIVTLARFNMAGDAIIVAKAHFVGTHMRDSYCSPYSWLTMDGDVSKFRHRLADGGYGAHLCMAYGDYVSQWQDLGELMGFKVEYFHG